MSRRLTGASCNSKIRFREFEKQLSQQQTSLSTLGGKLPATSLISPNFLTRAFAAWGYMIVAQLLIVIPLYCLIFGLSMLAGNGR